MRTISEEQLLERIRAENPWWRSGSLDERLHRLRPRAYFGLFQPLVEDLSVRRAIVLMGPRRVGKTVLLHHSIQSLLDTGIPAAQIAYISIDHPLYNGLGLEDLFKLYRRSVKSESNLPSYVYFDEIQYLKNWEIHLKALVDNEPEIKFVASGSAAAALNLKSHESGAGRFTDFLLPPLTFHEYLDLLNKGPVMKEVDLSGRMVFTTDDLSTLNAHFLSYLNYGGYPEVVFSETIRANPARFIKSDIIDKVLLRDLPSLYGISDVQELNKLFTTLAFNTADELSLQELSSNSGVAKNTIKKYIEYLEAAFLIRIVHRIDESAKRFKRARTFKVYLTNPSMRAALFNPVEADAPELGSLAETAVFSQYFHDEGADLYYSRWNKGEVDMVRLNAAQKPVWALEVKWSDRYHTRPGELKPLISFCRANNLSQGWATSRTIRDESEVGGTIITHIPAAELCYTVGYNIIHRTGGDRADSF